MSVVRVCVHFGSEVLACAVVQDPAAYGVLGFHSHTREGLSKALLFQAGYKFGVYEVPVHVLVVPRNVAYLARACAQTYDTDMVVVTRCGDQCAALGMYCNGHINPSTEPGY